MLNTSSVNKIKSVKSSEDDTRHKDTESTPYKSSEEALKSNADRFRAIFKQTAVGVAQVETKTGNFVMINKRYCDIVGYTQMEMNKATFMEITHPDDLITDLDNMLKLVDGEINSFTMEKRYCHKNGSTVWVNLTVSPMWNVGDKPDSHIAIVENITERKRMEEELKNLNENLEQQVRERTAELSGLNKIQKEDITERKKSEKVLQEQKEALEQKNIALNEVLGQIEIEKKRIKDNVIANAENLLLPIIEKISLKDQSSEYIPILKRNLLELTSSFGAKLSDKKSKLTPREIDICNMIKNGLTSKEIADLLDISLQTIEKHHAHIRRKLNIVNQKLNLSSVLKRL